MIKERQRKHKKRDHGLYRVYEGIQRRCKSKKFKHYKYYGGRGIKCLWKLYKEFRRDMLESYIKHLKKYTKKNTSIERINNNGNYCKENCKWATWKEQANNKRNKMI